MPEKISDLKHARRELSNGGEVHVLNRGSIITSEDEAMLQALHSRSTGGFKAHLESLIKSGSGKFMEQYYVKYGHKSIGDCADTTVFVDGVSMLAAKAIQDFPLYSGQEASTRYIDFSKQPFIDPTVSDAGRGLLELQREFYLDMQEPTKTQLRMLNPKREEEKQQVYDKAISARAFDITRGLLPAGAMTNLAWHGNLRQMADRLLWLRHHPLEEVRSSARPIEEALQESHPHSFDISKRYDATEGYQDLIADEYLYHEPNSPKRVEVGFKKIDLEEIAKYEDLFIKRPPKTELPKFLGQSGILDIRFALDFGSFRDIQRHRALNQRMPLLTTDLGFNQWYLDNLPGSLRSRIEDHIGKVSGKVDSIGVSPQLSQYFIPMGFNTSNKLTGDIPGVIYMVELRAKSDVHPTLQNISYDIASQIKNKLKIPVYTGSEPGRFDVKRGEQDIVKKQ